jgi:hypothetical protein
MKKSRLVLCILFFRIFPCGAQNIYDFKHTLEFAGYLYDKQNYSAAINEYNRAWFFGDLPDSSQVRLFQSYLFLKSYPDGIRTYRSKYPAFLANNDTLEVIYGKLLIAAGFYPDVFWLTGHSRSLTGEQSLYLNLSADLSAGNWDAAGNRRTALDNYPALAPYEDIFRDIESARHKSPALSLSLSALIPGLGKVYSGYWKDGLFSFTVIAVMAWQAYRGFDRYGPSRAYGWIYGSLSASFYLGNLYGSFKAANKRNHDIRQKIFNKVEDTYSELYTY